MDEAEKSVPDQVVLLVDPQSSTSKQSSEIIPQQISGDHNHRSESELKDEHSKEESKPQDEHNKEDSESKAEEEDHNKKCNIKLVVKITKWTAFIVITASLISTFTVPSLIHKTLWGLELGKWYLTILVVFCGRIVSRWLVIFFAFIIRLISYMLHHTFVYVDPDLRKGVQNCVWLGLVFLIWKLMVIPDVQVPSRYHWLLNKVTRALIVLLVGSIIWVVKIVVMKIATTLFHFSRIFDRIRENIVHLYIVDTLSCPPSDSKINQSWWKMLIGIHPKDLTKLSRKNLSWWNAKRLVRHIKFTWLSDDWKAKAAAKEIFKNVSGASYIVKDDLQKFFYNDEVDIIFPLFEGAVETERIEESAVTKMVVDAYQEQRDLIHSLKQREALMEQLHKLVSAVFIVVIFITSLLVTGVTTTNVIVVITSQLLLMGFIFGNTSKTIFESMVFLFIQNPFDVGDRCVIDGIEMVVQEMEVLTTTFLRLDNDKIIYYPNVELLKKSISNFSRSSHIGGIIEFSVDVSHSSDISAMEERIKRYIKNNPKHWRPNHSVEVKSVEDSTKMKIAVHVMYTRNFQNSRERNDRRLELRIELKKILNELSMINYNLPAQRIIPPQSTTATHGDSMTQDDADAAMGRKPSFPTMEDAWTVLIC